MVAVRQSYLDWLLRQIDSTTGATFGYLDGQGKVTIDLSPRQTLRASIIAGRSALKDQEENPDPNELVVGKSQIMIGNLQWRFTRVAAVCRHATGLRAEGRLRQRSARWPQSR